MVAEVVSKMDAHYVVASSHTTKIVKPQALGYEHSYSDTKEGVSRYINAGDTKFTAFPKGQLLVIYKEIRYSLACTQNGPQEHTT